MKRIHDEGIILEEGDKRAAYSWWREPTPLGAASASLRLFALLMELLAKKRSAKSGKYSDR